MKVSVVIPSYNHEKFIAEAIQSVLNQTFQDFEIIITDDGSTDNTVAEIEKFDDSRIKFFSHEKNEGFYFAFKRCLKEASGDYIAMLSSDDVFLPNKLEKQVKFLDDHDKYAAVFGFAQIIDEDGNDFTDKDHFYSTIFIQENRTRYEWLRKFFYEGNCLCHPSVLIRKEFYTIDQFDPRYRQLPDFDFWVKLLMKTEIYILQENLIKFRLLNSEMNASGNNPVNSTRTSYELSRILDLYLTRLSVEDYLKCFYEDRELKHITKDDVSYLIAIKAIETDRIDHKHFALNTLFNLLKDEDRANSIKNKFNFTHNDFFERVGNSNLYNRFFQTHASLYIDTGNGFSEEQKLFKNIMLQKTTNFTLEYDLSSFKNIKNIRFDPIEGEFCIVRMNKIIIENLDNQQIDYKIFDKNNGTLIDQNSFIFTTNDPMFFLKVHNPKKILLSYEIELLDKEQQIQEKDKQIQNQDAQIQHWNKDQQIQEKDAQIQHWHDVAQSMRIKNRIKRVIKKIIPKKLWKILKYIKHNPQAIKRIINVLNTKGFQGLRNEINKVDSLHNTYIYHEPMLNKVIAKEITSFAIKPLVSIIMPVYNVDPKWLNLAIKSIEKQWYQNWELCIVDDKSTNRETIKYLKSINNSKIKVKFLEENGNISVASNEALSLTVGEYIALMDNDDELTPDALYEVVKVINRTGSEFIYSDEDKLEMDGTFSDPHFKPDFAPDMLLSQNYMSHLGVIKKDLIDKVDGFTVGLEGAQDHDLYLKVLEHTDKVNHISKVLYHWRKIPGSTEADFDDKSYAKDAGMTSLKNAMVRRDIDAEILNAQSPGTYRVKYKIIGNPLVSIIIPFKDKPALLTMCIESILDKTTYENFEVIGISNNSEEEETFTEMRRLESLDSRIKFYEYNVPFNYSDINNYAVRTYAKGEQIILLNNDIEIITPTWIESMLEFSQRSDVGAVGAKLYYPNDTIQHAGVILGIGGLAGHSHKHSLKDNPGYLFRLNLIQNLSAVTAACLMVKKSIFEEVDGLNEKELKVAFNDVDFCLRVQEKGYMNIFTPYCEAYHHESISRGVEDTVEKQERFKSEVDYMQDRHKNILRDGDPFYNPNLTLNREDFSLK